MRPYPKHIFTILACVGVVGVTILVYVLRADIRQNSSTASRLSDANKIFSSPGEVREAKYACLKELAAKDPQHQIYALVRFQIPIALNYLKHIVSFKELEVASLDYHYAGMRGYDGLRAGENFDRFRIRLEQEVKESLEQTFVRCYQHYAELQKTLQTDEKYAVLQSLVANCNASTTEFMAAGAYLSVTGPYVDSVTVAGSAGALMSAAQAPEVAIVAAQGCEHIPMHGMAPTTTLATPERTWEDLIRGFKNEDLNTILAACSPEPEKQDRCRRLFSAIKETGRIREFADSFGPIHLTHDLDELRFYEFEPLDMPNEPEEVSFLFLPDVGWKIEAF